MDIEEIRPAMNYLSQHYQKGDRFYLKHTSQPAFEYYAKRVGLEDVQWQRGMNSEHNCNTYIDELRCLRGKDRVWILFSYFIKNNGIDEEKFFYMFWMEWEGRLIRLNKRALPSTFMIYISVLVDSKSLPLAVKGE